jgi:hypothetical protein
MFLWSPTFECLASVKDIAILPISGSALPNAAKKRPFALVAQSIPDDFFASFIEFGRPITNGNRFKILFGIAESLQFLLEIRLLHRCLTVINVPTGVKNFRFRG